MMNGPTPALLSWGAYASQAIAARQWGQALIALRHHLASNGNDSGAQIQLGECLLQLGQFTAAAAAFEIAIKHEPARWLALVNFGYLARAQHDFAGALTFFEEAATLVDHGSAAMRDIDALIAKVQPLAAATKPAVLPADTTLLVFSGPNMAVSRASTPARSNLGEANYSYAFAARGFLEALGSSGTEPELIMYPEYVAHGARSFGARHCVHLRFSPPTNPRMIRGATNILVFAWEFDELPMAAGWPHPFADRQAVINRFDEVWMPSRHGASVIAGLTQANVRFVPSPVLPRRSGRHWREGEFLRSKITHATLPEVRFVPLSVFPQFQGSATAYAKSEAQSLRTIVARLSDRPKIFLTIANPHDRRKNLRPLIEAFGEHARHHPNTILLIKCSAFDATTDSINNLIFSHQLARDEESLAAFVSKSIWITNQALDDDDLDELYAIADFYICTPVAEGQNLPLLEAMLRGCVPVTPRHTAMIDYITTENAIILASRRAAPTEQLRQEYGLRNAEVDHIDPADVEVALAAADLLSSDRIAAIALAAKLTVRTQYNAEKVSLEWERLRNIATRQPSVRVMRK